MGASCGQKKSRTAAPPGSVIDRCGLFRLFDEGFIDTPGAGHFLLHGNHFVPQRSKAVSDTTSSTWPNPNSLIFFEVMMMGMGQKYPSVSSVTSDRFIAAPSSRSIMFRIR